MNLILLEPDELRPTVTLAGRRAAHVRTVLRAAVGGALSVGVVGGRVGRGTVVALEAERVTLEVVLDAEPPPPTGISLVLAVPRPKILRKVLQAVASMGVERLALIGSYRVEKSYFGATYLEPGPMREELVLGLEQGRDTRLPQVEVHRFFKPFVEDVLDGAFPDAQRLLPHPKAEAALPGLRSAPVVLAIGPEGGWTEYEARTLEERGFAPFSLGPRILRVDVAVPYLVGQVALRRER